MNSEKLAVNVNRTLDLLPNFVWPLKVYLIRAAIGEIGKGVKISRSAYFENPFHVKIGDHVFINRDFYCSVDKSLHICDRVMIGPGCTIIGGDHKFNDPTVCMRFPDSRGDNRDILIEEDAWIGSGVMLLKKSKIGEGSIIGANSLVTGSVLPYSVYAGQPAKFMKPRFDTHKALLGYLDMMEKKYGFRSRYENTILESLYTG